MQIIKQINIIKYYYSRFIVNNYRRLRIFINFQNPPYMLKVIVEKDRDIAKRVRKFVENNNWLFVINFVIVIIIVVNVIIIVFIIIIVIIIVIMIIIIIIIN